MPQNILPDSFLYESRKCPRCRKEKQFLKNDARKYCEDCRAYARSYKHQHKVFKLSKEDLARIEEDNKRKFRELSLKFETTQSDCLMWRRMYEKGQKSDFFFNHNGFNICLSCSAWVAKRKKSSALDINDVGDKSGNYEELRAFVETMRKPNEPD